MDILANSARSDDGASDEEGEDRMRDLLASYYGLSNDGPANETNQEMRGSTVSSEQREREVEGDHEIGATSKFSNDHTLLHGFSAFSVHAIRAASPQDQFSLRPFADRRRTRLRG